MKPTFLSVVIRPCHCVPLLLTLTCTVSLLCPPAMTDRSGGDWLAHRGPTPALSGSDELRRCNVAVWFELAARLGQTENTHCFAAGLGTARPSAELNHRLSAPCNRISPLLSTSSTLQSSVSSNMCA
ncbi:hypothetical protein BC835DRAFT_315802 [Cytidiella melzeri]|nr:hypothetical protein BC835DRAFT_315802 [Cytidiella melzeri]